ncbi:MAG: hypothetical protein SGI92_00115 [Bryobacteraceae bacterium]|nr:hypothetical protein [Bryobacteraceae bacterium]
MAASQKQIEANRRNAEKSTGPKTAEGRQASRANATTHGLTAKTTIYRPVRNENPQEFEAFRDALIADYKPANFREMLTIEMIAAAYKRIQRAEAWEAAFVDGSMEATQRAAGVPIRPGAEADDLGAGIVLGKDAYKLTWANLDRYRRNAWLDYNRATEQLRRHQKDHQAAEKQASSQSPQPQQVRAHTSQMASFCPPAQSTEKVTELPPSAPEQAPQSRHEKVSIAPQPQAA